MPLNIIWSPGLLPSEVLLAIFILATPGTHNALIHVSGTAQAPWNFAAVCRKWRNTCLSNPSLWTYFTLAGHRCKMIDTTCINEVLITQCILQLQRSGSQLLSVNMEVEGAECSFARSFIRAVGAHSKRWERLEVSLWEMKQRRFAELLPINVDLSSVKSLAYRCHSSDEFKMIFDGNITDDRQPILTHAKNLTSLTLSQWCGRAGQVFDAPGFPYTQLRNLHLDAYGGYVSSLLDLLGNRPSSLESLQWTPDSCLDVVGVIDQDLDRYMESTSDILLAQLTHLDITLFSRKDILLRALPLLQAPKLYAVTIRGYMDDVVARLLTSFISRSNCQIRSFRATLPTCGYSGPSPISGYLALLDRLESVENLVLIGDAEHQVSGSTKIDDDRDMPWPLSHLDDVLLRPLTEAPAPHILPNLRRLAFKDAHFDPILLLHMLQARQRAVGHSSATGSVQRLEIDYLASMSVEGSTKIARYYEMVLRAGMGVSDVLESELKLGFDPSESEIYPYFQM